MKLVYSNPENIAFPPQPTAFEVTKVFQNIITDRKIPPVYGIPAAATYVVPNTDIGQGQIFRILQMQENINLFPDRITDIRGGIINGV